MIWWLGLTSVLLVGLDQLTKYWAVQNLRPVGEIPLINGLLSLIYVENEGAAFGLLQGGRWFFIPLTVLVLAGLLVYYARMPRTKEYYLVRIPLLLIFAGAVGNFIDRLRNGYVVDMLAFTFIDFPVFNVADMCLVCGTFVLAFVLLFVVKDPA